MSSANKASQRNSPENRDCEHTNTGVESFREFERLSLQQLKSSDLNLEPFFLLPLPAIALAVGAAALSLGGVAWAFMARVPAKVNAVGYVVSRTPQFQAVSRTSGEVFFQVPGAGVDRLDSEQKIRNNQIERYWANNDLYYSDSKNPENLYELIQQTTAFPSGQDMVTTEMLGDGFSYDNINSPEQAVFIKPNTVVAIVYNIETAETMKTMLREKQSVAVDANREIRENRLEVRELNRIETEQKRQLLRDQQAIARRKELLKAQSKLWQEGAIAKSDLISEEERMNTFQGQMLNSERNLSDIASMKRERNRESRRTGEHSADVLNALEAKLISAIDASYIFSHDEGAYLIRSDVTNRSEVMAGDVIFTYTKTPPHLPRVIPIFLTSEEAVKVEEGMDVLVTPRGISRAQYGGIRGRVVNIKSTPFDGRALARLTGSESAAQLVGSLRREPYVAMVQLEIGDGRYCEQIMSKRCYRWSSGRVPPHPVRIGTLVDVQVTTGTQRPVDFVMPALKSALGID